MELTRTNVKEFFRPNLWPNTPDILPEYLQYGGRPAFMIRLILAATLGASYGIYGPPYEVCENIPREPGSEEYLNSEKYEIRHWDLSAPGSLGELMTRINQLRRANPALRQNDTLRFHEVDNPELLAYSKSSPDGTNLVLAIVNLDPHHTQSGWVSLNLPDADLPIKGGLQAHDLLTDARYLWHHGHNFVQLNPHLVPAHILKLRRYLRTEHDFDYFL
jgi:starch synthase (maltosyl-transferring)